MDLIITNMLKPSNSVNKYQLSQPFDALRPLYFPKADYNDLCSYLMDLVIMWSYLKNIIFTGMNGYIPKVRHRKCQYPCWFTPELRHLSNCTRTLRRRISKNPTTTQILKLSELKVLANRKENTQC